MRVECVVLALLLSNLGAGAGALRVAERTNKHRTLQADVCAQDVLGLEQSRPTLACTCEVMEGNITDLSCVDGCETCSEDLSLCGLDTFAQTYDAEGSVVALSETFTYTAGRNATVVMSYDGCQTEGESTICSDCTVSVDGEDCFSCTVTACQGGPFNGEQRLSFVCANLELGAEYDLCDENLDIPLNSTFAFITGMTDACFTQLPSASPTGIPSQIPSDMPSLQPSGAPSASPTAMPTMVPSAAPTGAPTVSPAPTFEGQTPSPTTSPSASPTAAPVMPTPAPTFAAIATPSPSRASSSPSAVVAPPTAGLDQDGQQAGVSSATQVSTMFYTVSLSIFAMIVAVY